MLRVAVIVSTRDAWGQQLVRGIASYAHEDRRWDIFNDGGGFEQSLIFSGGYHWDGLIATIQSREQMDQLKPQRRSRRPIVNVSSIVLPGRGLPCVKVDDRKLAELALRHLLAAGFRRFAYCGRPYDTALDPRGKAFVQLADAEKFLCEAFSAPRRASPPLAHRARMKWIRQLSKPVGIFTWDAAVGRQIVETCTQADIAIPHDAAVIAGDDDKLMCELVTPTVSAIAVPSEKIGYEAAKLLDCLISGQPPPAEPILIVPTGVLFIRQSSDTSAMEDRDVHRALQFIRDHKGESLTVAQLVKALPVTRRRLEQQFRRVLNRSPHEEIHLARLGEAKKLLLETDWPITRLAKSAGFNSVRHLNYVFKKDLNLSPLGYRKRYRVK